MARPKSNTFTWQRHCDYEIIDLLGRVEMGEVYRAHDARIVTDRALRTMPPAIPMLTSCAME